MTEKKTILLKTNQTLRMYRDNDYIGSIRNFTESIEVNTEQYPSSKEICIDYFLNGLSLHLWCTRYEVVENDN